MGQICWSKMFFKIQSLVHSTHKQLTRSALFPHLRRTELMGYNRMQFLTESLRNLDDQLRALGGQLYVMKGEPTVIFKILHAEAGMSRLTLEQVGVCGDDPLIPLGHIFVKIMSMIGWKITFFIFIIIIFIVWKGLSSFLLLLLFLLLF